LATRCTDTSCRVSSRMTCRSWLTCRFPGYLTTWRPGAAQRCAVRSLSRRRTPCRAVGRSTSCPLASEPLAIRVRSSVARRSNGLRGSFLARSTLSDGGTRPGAAGDRPGAGALVNLRHPMPRSRAGSWCHHHRDRAEPDLAECLTSHRAVVSPRDEAVIRACRDRLCGSGSGSGPGPRTGRAARRRRCRLVDRRPVEYARPTGNLGKRLDRSS
jgi:hypothetical protein